MWHGEALYGLEVQGVKALIPLGAFFPAKCGSSISAKFLIYRAHAVCFCILVSILDPLQSEVNIYEWAQDSSHL
jgi:hypothetical protein